MDEFGRELIKAVNNYFETGIEITEDNAGRMSRLIHELVCAAEYGYCPDCDDRMPDEPVRDESRE